MTNRGMAGSHLAQSEEIWKEAESLLHRGVWNLVVRRSQEAVELALKAALRSVGVEVPRLHDVGVLVKEQSGKFPGAFTRDIDKIASISRRLRREREISFYGDDEMDVPPEQIYAELDAREALEEARFVLERCKSTLENSLNS